MKYGDGALAKDRPPTLERKPRMGALARSLPEASMRTGLSPEKLLLEAHTVARLARLFNAGVVPYALNGGAALNLIFLRKMRRVPSDIDLRCDDLETCRRVFADLFVQIEKPSPVEMYCFRDENGVMIDITQNRFPRIKTGMKASSVLCEFGFSECSADVLSYDFEALFAEKLIALARKKDYKDLYDAYSCLSMEIDQTALIRYLREVGEHDKINPFAIADSSYCLDGGRGGDAPDVQGLSENEMLRKVQSFIRRFVQ